MASAQEVEMLKRQLDELTAQMIEVRQQSSSTAMNAAVSGLAEAVRTMGQSVSKPRPEDMFSCQSLAEVEATFGSEPPPSGKTVDFGTDFSLTLLFFFLFLLFFLVRRNLFFLSLFFRLWRRG